MGGMTERPITIRAQVALADLAVILHGGTRDDVDRWATKYSWSDSKRDVGVLVALTELAARAHPGEHDNETVGGSFANQLVAARGAGDDTVVDGLVQIWVESPPPTRADVLHELIRFLSR